jgi:hypothetical protein
MVAGIWNQPGAMHDIAVAIPLERLFLGKGLAGCNVLALFSAVLPLGLILASTLH